MTSDQCALIRGCSFFGLHTRFWRFIPEQILCQILISESLQTVANCIKYSYNLLDSPIYIFSGGKMWHTKEYHFWQRGRYIQTVAGKGNPSHWPHSPPRAICPSQVVPWEWQPRRPVTAPICCPQAPRALRTLPGGQVVHCCLVNMVKSLPLQPLLYWAFDNSVTE